MRMIRLCWQRESFVCDKHADGVKAGSHERLADESASGGAWAFFAPLAGCGAGGALPGVTVRAMAGAASGDSPLAPSAPRERRRLARIAGGTALALPQDKGRLTGLRDALGVQPGVIVQDLFGGFDAPRLNVRGSGLQSHPVNRGVTLLLDGLPLNDADGTYVSGLADPRNTAQISIRRGANARSPAGESLGGEMDFQSLTGYDGRGQRRKRAGCARELQRRALPGLSPSL